jgi:predicted lipase
MITDIDCVRACADTYTLPPTVPVPASGVHCHISVIDRDGDAAILAAFRGSVTEQDWGTDFDAFPIEERWARWFMGLPVNEREHDQLGLCHAGFLGASESVVDAVLAELKNSSAALPVKVTGHSYGGALALGVGALMKLAGRAPVAIVTFGAPRFGMAKFVAGIADIPVRQYRRGNDPVPCVPFDVSPELMWLDARDPLIAIGQAQRNPFACHHIAGYVDDVMAYLSKQAA